MYQVSFITYPENLLFYVAIKNKDYYGVKDVAPKIILPKIALLFAAYIFLSVISQNCF